MSDSESHTFVHMTCICIPTAVYNTYMSVVGRYVHIYMYVQYICIIYHYTTGVIPCEKTNFESCIIRMHVCCRFIYVQVHVRT